jgi:glycosyltransferase involved in cell wall biosynthesis
MAILYITYDGLLDPLGPSQILPYVKDISRHQDEVVVVSFEKSERLLHGKDALLSDLRNYSITWKPLLFTKGLGFLGKLLDLSRMYLKAFIIACKYNIKVVHTRSHPPAQVGLFIKRITKAKFIFDFRGLWVDERVDKGGWDLNRFFHRLQYKYFKRVERKLLVQSDHVVVLTNKVVDEVIKLGAIEKSKITVIPCCADYNHFPLSTDTRKIDARISLGIPTDAFVLGYLGSIGRMYLLDRFFHLFKLAAKVRKDCHALLITRDTSALKQLMKCYLTPELSGRVHVKSASRDEVPVFLPAMDVMVSFIFSTYARTGASPTKMAECFATGIPAIANPGVGDVKQVVDRLDGGWIVDPYSDADLMEVVQKLDTICSKGGQRLRDASRSILGLEYATQCYQSVYDKLV